MSRERAGQQGDDLGAELVFALCHEVGNLVGAVRLHAHLLDDDMGARALALASVELDDLSARASALLAQVRPLLSEPDESERVDPAVVLAVVRQLMEEFGGRGKTVSVDPGDELPEAAIGKEVLQPLLTSLLYAALEAVDGGGRVALFAERRGEQIAFVIEDDGEVDEDPRLWREQMRRGRPLLSAIADFVLGRRGGRLEVELETDPRATRLCLLVPVAAG